MKSRTFAAICMSLGFSIACDEKPPKESTVVQATGPAVPVPAIEDIVEEVPQIDEARVRQLLETWVNAQNDGDFQAYSDLYAQKFNGIKRSGAKTTTFDLSGWILDRQRMFQKKMEVDIDDVQTVTTSQSAVVRFTQTWASGTFRDIGPKQLVILDTPDGLRIAREEMLTSTVVAGEHPLPMYDPAELAILIDDSYVVLRLDDTGVNSGPARLLKPQGEAIADLKDSKEFSGFLGKRVAVHSVGNPRCESTIESLHVMARVTPHFGQVAVWTGQDPDIAQLSDDAIANEIWELAKGARVVVGRLKAACEGGQHARILGEDVSDHGLRVLDAKPALRNAAAETFRKLDGFKDVQKVFQQDTGQNAMWDSTGQLTVMAFGGQSAKVEYLAVSATAGDGCGGFRGEFWALYQVSPNGNLTLLTDGKAPGNLFVPTGAAMIGRDVVFVSEDRLVRKMGTVWRPVHEAQKPYYDCPC